MYLLEILRNKIRIFY